MIYPRRNPWIDAIRAHVGRDALPAVLAEARALADGATPPVVVEEALAYRLGAGQDVPTALAALRRQAAGGRG